MQQLQTPLIFRGQTVAVPPGVLGPAYAVITPDVEMHPTDPREGYVTVGGRRGRVVQSFPPFYDGQPVFFLFEWLDQPGVFIW